MNEKLTIDKALRIYTDKLNGKEPIDMEYFKENLSDKQFKEFESLVPFIKNLKILSLIEECKESDVK